MKTEQITLISAPIGRVGACAIGCGTPAEYMLTARMRCLRTSTFVCATHYSDGQARALRLLAEQLEVLAVEYRRDQSARLARARAAHV